MLKNYRPSKVRLQIQECLKKKNFVTVPVLKFRGLGPSSDSQANTCHLVVVQCNGAKNRQQSMKTQGWDGPIN